MSKNPKFVNSEVERILKEVVTKQVEMITLLQQLLNGLSIEGVQPYPQYNYEQPTHTEEKVVTE